MTLLQTSFVAFLYFSAMFFLAQYIWRSVAIKSSGTSFGKGLAALVF